jgi:hypothetical protein
VFCCSGQLIAKRRSLQKRMLRQLVKQPPQPHKHAPKQKSARPLRRLQPVLMLKACEQHHNLKA